jgi:hypothetical protein
MNIPKVARPGSPSTSEWRQRAFNCVISSDRELLMRCDMVLRFVDIDPVRAMVVQYGPSNRQGGTAKRCLSTTQLRAEVTWRKA